MKKISSRQTHGLHSLSSSPKKKPTQRLDFKFKNGFNSIFTNDAEIF